MRDEIEVKRAHDIHEAIAVDQLIPFDDGEKIPLYAAVDAVCSLRDVLCWVLGHQHNRSCPTLLAGVEKMAAARAKGTAYSRQQSPGVPYGVADSSTGTTAEGA